jgi:predicted amidohydrolase
MKVAAFQAPLLAAGSFEAIALIQERVAWCESEGVSILCCPEAILGGLADYCEDPALFAIRTDDNQLNRVLAPLASETVTSIIGFTELADDRLYNAAAVFHLGRVAGLYRKLHPAIRRSVYSAGDATPVFQVNDLTFGVVICNDSNFAEPARAMAEKGARVLFVPTNNGLPVDRKHKRVAEEARNADVALAKENGVWIVRADVEGTNGALMSWGASEIVDPSGTIVRSAVRGGDPLLVADIGQIV